MGGSSRGNFVGRVGRHKFNLAAGWECAHKGGLPTEETDQINEVRGARRFALWLLALVVRLWGRTLRFQADDETRRRLMFSDQPLAVVLWHNRLFLSAEIFRRYRTRRRVYGLVSASKDGAWLAAFYRMIGIYPVRGSSSNLGREAAKILIEKMREGHDVGITPDGPRGPMYTLEPGVLVVTRRRQAPMVLIGVEFGPAYRLKSWDGFYLPRPFSTVKMRGIVLPPQKETGEKFTAEEVRQALRAINPDA